MVSLLIVLAAVAPRADERARAASLSAESQLAAAQGDYARAVETAQKSAALFHALGEVGGEARAVYRTGVAELYQAHYAPALRHLQQALALARTAGDRELGIEAVNNAGTTHFLQARYLDALRAYREAIDELAQAGGESWAPRLRRITLTNLAALFQRLGQDEQALHIYREVRDGPEALAASEQARLLANLGVLYRRLGDPVKALETYRAAQHLLDTDAHADARIGLLRNIGIVEALDMDDLPAALQAFTSALELAVRTGNRREAMQARLYRGEALYRAGDAAPSAQEFAAAIGLARELGTTEEEWKGLYGLGRIARAQGHDDEAAARFGEAIARIESVRMRLQLSSLTSEFLADKRDAYDALLEILLQRGDARAMFDVLERSRSRSFQDRVSTAPPSLAQVQARLPPDTVLLEYWAGPRQAAVLWVRRDGCGVARVQVDQRELAELIDAVSSGGDDWRRLAVSAGAHLVSPALAGLAGPVQRLVVVPDGPVANLPFELLDAQGLLLERFDVWYLPTAALLLRPPSRAPRWRPPWKSQLVAFADPQVAEVGQGGAPELGGAELADPLPASRDEAKAIARVCPGRSRLYLGRNNLKRYLIQGAAAGVPLLHLATHAVADFAFPERSRILFSPSREQDGADYLFLKEVYDLDLRGVALATLSACDTERGKLVRGEGTQGFSRALLAAGAQAAVTSLWRVSDEAARDFMAQFYLELNRGETQAHALRLAKLRFLRSGTALAHPRFWAAFVLTGDGAGTIPRVISWSGLLAAAGALLAGSIAAATWRARASVTRSGPGFAPAPRGRTGISPARGPARAPPGEAG